MQAALIASLEREGIAFTTAESFLGEELWQELQDAVAAQVAGAKMLLTLTRQGRIVGPYKVPARAGPEVQAPLVNKSSYLVKLLGDRPMYEAKAVWARVAEAPALVEVAAAHLRKPPVLKMFNVWYTLPSTKPPRDSQLWHQDKNDTRIVKAFIYLSDVTKDAGPLTYIQGTHGGTVSRFPAMSLDYAGVPRATDDQMAEVYPPEDWLQAAGPVGTVVLVDTSGFHKGGHGSIDRVMFTAMYTTAAGYGLSFERAVGALPQAAPWRRDEEYAAYLEAQVEKTTRMRGTIAGSRVARLVGILVRADSRSAKGRSVLCIGCRNEYELSVLEAAGFGPVTGIDLVSPDSRNIKLMDMHALAIPDQSLDVIFACHSLEHAYDVGVVLKEWARVTRPGGVWAIEVPINYTTTPVDRHDFASTDKLIERLAPYTARVLYTGGIPQQQVARVVVQIHG